MSETVERNDALLSGMASTAITVGIIVTVVLFWTRFALAELPLSIPPMVYFLGSVLFVQPVRSVRMDEWGRRGAALGVVVGVLVIIAGLRPVAGCAATSPLQCSTSFDPSLPLLALGFLLTTALLYFDIRRR